MQLFAEDRKKLLAVGFGRSFFNAWLAARLFFKAGSLKLTAKSYFCCMTIDNKVVENLAHLARLRFDELEKESIRDGLEKMVAFVEKLQTVDTAGVEPLLHISDVTNVLREDVVQGSITREEALLNAPVKDEAFFKVPKVIKK